MYGSPQGHGLKQNCHSLHRSKMFLKVKMCPEVPRPFLNPACSFRRVVFTTLSIFMITVQNTFLCIDRIVTPLQLLQSARFPFLGISFYNLIYFLKLVQKSVFSLYSFLRTAKTPLLPSAFNDLYKK